MIGKTGTGKSSLFLSMIIQDILKGNGVGVIDPHGDLIKEILDYFYFTPIKFDLQLIDHFNNIARDYWGFVGFVGFKEIYDRLCFVITNLINNAGQYYFPSLLCFLLLCHCAWVLP